MNYIVNENNNIVDVTNKEVIIFGAGYYGGKILPYMLKYDDARVRAVFDNDALKHGKMIWEEIHCLSPRLVDRMMPVIIAVENIEVRVSIKKQCEDLGYIYIYNLNIEELMNCVAMLPDKQYMELQYYCFAGKILDLSCPKTFNEKMQWLKLYDRKNIYTKMVDKYEVRNIIRAKIGEEYLIPLLGVWDSFDEINFDKLPDQFVLKCTHDSGGLYICKDKEDFDIKKCSEKINHCLKKNWYTISREWPYKDVTPRIIAEKYMTDESGWELKDYKVFVFNGKAKLVEVDYNRYVNHKLNVYDLEWNYMDCYFTSHNDPNVIIPKPRRLQEMLKIAEKLSTGLPFLRVDFYSIFNELYVGELTFYPGSGFVEFYPEEIDLTMGDWLVLPDKV